MGLLSSIGKLSRNEARHLRSSQMRGSTRGFNAEFGMIPVDTEPQLQRSASAALGGMTPPNIGATGMSEVETEVVRMLQSGLKKEQIADQLYRGGVPPQFVETVLRQAQRKLMSAGELF